MGSFCPNHILANIFGVLTPKWGQVPPIPTKSTLLPECASLMPSRVKVEGAFSPAGAFSEKRYINKKNFVIFHAYTQKSPVHRFASNLASGTVGSPRRCNCDKFCGNRFRIFYSAGNRILQFPYLNYVSMCDDITTAYYIITGIFTDCTTL